jgi:hypothetical protein
MLVAHQVWDTARPHARALRVGVKVGQLSLYLWPRRAMGACQPGSHCRLLG